MKRPILMPRRRDTSDIVESIDVNDFDGTIEKAIELFQNIKDRYPDQQVTLDKEYDSSFIRVYVEKEPESEMEFEVRKIQYEKDLKEYQQWEAKQAEEREKQLYLKLKNKYERPEQQ
jgi:hypothetical protein